MSRAIVLAAAAFAAFAAPAFATPTEVVVRVISQDAKFVGDTMGGAEVVLRDARSGVILAKGVTSGGTGDTSRIMASSGRSPQRATEGAAAFRTQIDLDRPTLVRVEIKGPLGAPDTVHRASSERWLVPGQPATVGDGWVIELPGLAIKFASEPSTVFQRGITSELTAEVQLMCGCPITPGGLWDAANYEVSAEFRRAGSARERLELPFVAAPGRFKVSWKPQIAGKFELVVVARNRVTGNTGVLTRKVTVR